MRWHNFIFKTALRKTHTAICQKFPGLHTAHSGVLVGWKILLCRKLFVSEYLRRRKKPFYWMQSGAAPTERLRVGFLF